MKSNCIISSFPLFENYKFPFYDTLPYSLTVSVALCAPSRGFVLRTKIVAFLNIQEAINGTKDERRGIGILEAAGRTI